MKVIAESAGMMRVTARLLAALRRSCGGTTQKNWSFWRTLEQRDTQEWEDARVHGTTLSWRDRPVQEGDNGAYEYFTL